MKTVSVPILATVAIGLVIMLAFSRVTQSNLEEENRGLRKQLEELTAPRDDSQAGSSVVRAAEPLPETAIEELNRLRGEVSNLRAQKQQLEQLRVENETLRARNETTARSASQTPSADGKIYHRNNWTFSGFGDPRSALQSLLWAGASGDAATALAALTPDQIARMKSEDNQNRTEEEIAARLAKEISKVESYQILKSQPLSDTETVLTLYIEGLEGSEQTPRMKMQLINNEWRLAGPYRDGQEKQQ